jgi:hypothetical protein
MLGECSWDLGGVVARGGGEAGVIAAAFAFGFVLLAVEQDALAE